MIVGAAEPNFIDVGLQADSLFGRHLSRGRTKATRPYDLTSSPGKSWATDVDVYKDPDLQAFYERLREGEMTQAAFRIRPLEGPHKLILGTLQLATGRATTNRAYDYGGFGSQARSQRPSTHPQIANGTKATTHSAGQGTNT